MRWHRTILEESIHEESQGLDVTALPIRGSDAATRYVLSSDNRRLGDPSLKRPQATHPHSGAVDELGNYGYVHNPTVLHYHRKSSINVTKEERKQLCARSGDGPEGGSELGRQVFDKIRISHSTNTAKRSSIKVFCAIYTHAGNNNQTQAIRETWGSRCDGFMAASTETVHEDATVELLQWGSHQGMYKGIWQKVRSILGYIYDNFLNDFDFFFLCGDDTYVIVENLKDFLSNPSFVEHAGGEGYPKAVYTGAWIHPLWLVKEGYSPNFYYMGGGSGYVLNRAAVKGLVELAWPTCRSTTNDSAEDVYMAECLEKYLNVTGFDARDYQERERFIPHDPVQRAMIPGVPSSELVEPEKNCGPRVRKVNQTQSKQLSLLQQLSWLQRKHGWTQKYGVDFLSPSAISFHMVQPALKMRRYDQLLYRNSRIQFGDTIHCDDENTQ